MGLQWRVDILDLLKEKGYSSYRIRKENIFNQSTLQNLRHQRGASWKDIETVCKITGKQPGKLLEYVPDE